MRTVDEIRALADEFVGPAFVDQALAAVLPAWYLVEEVDGPMRIGGPAPLTAGEAWPVGSHGVALTFIAALPLAALPAMPADWAARLEWPHHGETLRIFADLVANPHEAAPALILPAPREATFVNTAAPPLPRPWPLVHRYGVKQDDLEDEVRVRELPLVRARFVPELTLDAFALGLIEDEERYEETWEPFEEEIWHGAYGHEGIEGWTKVGGAPRHTMDDPRAGYVLAEEPDDLGIVLEFHDGFGGLDVPNDGAYVFSASASTFGRDYTPALGYLDA